MPTALSAINDEQPISNKNFAFSQVTMQSRAFIGYEIAHRIQCAVDIINQ